MLCSGLGDLHLNIKKLGNKNMRFIIISSLLASISCLQAATEGEKDKAPSSNTAVLLRQREHGAISPASFQEEMDLKKRKAPSYSVFRKFRALSL